MFLDTRSIESYVHDPSQTKGSGAYIQRHLARAVFILLSFIRALVHSSQFF
jgi:hypothetical protein